MAVYQICKGRFNLNNLEAYKDNKALTAALASSNSNEPLIWNSLLALQEISLFPGVLKQ